MHACTCNRISYYVLYLYMTILSHAQTLVYRFVSRNGISTICYFNTKTSNNYFGNQKHDRTIPLMEVSGCRNTKCYNAVVDNERKKKRVLVLQEILVKPKHVFSFHCLLLFYNTLYFCAHLLPLKVNSMRMQFAYYDHGVKMSADI